MHFKMFKTTQYVLIGTSRRHCSTLPFILFVTKQGPLFVAKVHISLRILRLGVPEPGSIRGWVLSMRHRPGHPVRRPFWAGAASCTSRSGRTGRINPRHLWEGSGKSPIRALVGGGRRALGRLVGGGRRALGEASVTDESPGGG